MMNDKWQQKSICYPEYNVAVFPEHPPCSVMAEIRWNQNLICLAAITNEGLSKNLAVQNRELCLHMCILSGKKEFTVCNIYALKISHSLKCIAVFPPHASPPISSFQLAFLLYKTIRKFLKIQKLTSSIFYILSF